MKRTALLIIVFAALMAFGVAAHAETLPTGYTDGTETYPHFCNADQTVCNNEDGTGFGPVPYGPVFTDECATIEYDPTYVYVTEHFDYDGDGQEDAYRVVPYEYEDGAHVVSSDVEALVAGQAGTVWLTWNIGSGETDRVPFDCRPDPTTTTTVPDTTTTDAPATTTTTTDIGVPTDARLPETGTSTTPLLIGGLAAIACGTVLARKARSN